LLKRFNTNQLTLTKRKKGFIFNKKTLALVIEDEKKKFEQDLRKSSREKNVVFESSVMDLYLNGYNATRLSDEQVQKIEASFIISASTENFLRKVKLEIAKVIGFEENITLHSFMYEFYKVLSHSFKNLHYIYA